MVGFQSGKRMVGRGEGVGGVGGGIDFVDIDSVEVSVEEEETPHVEDANSPRTSLEHGRDAGYRINPVRLPPLHLDFLPILPK